MNHGDREVIVAVGGYRYKNLRSPYQFWLQKQIFQIKDTLFNEKKNHDNINF